MAPLAYFLGCPFWSFGEWNGGLYSADARPADRLRQYARVFNAVEGNTTFYSSPARTTAERWREAVPPGFRFCFKIPREITHDRRLRDAAAATAAFFRAIEPLADRLGPFHVQLPPALGPSGLGDLDAFLRSLPREHEYSVELRHPAFFRDPRSAEAADALLGRHDAGRVMMDTRALRAGDPNHPEVRAALHKKPDLPLRPAPLSERPMVRFVGHPDATANEPYLDEWAARVATWIGEGRTPYFFVHTASNRTTPLVARDLHERIARRVPAGALPPFPGETGEGAAGQLALF